MPLPAVIWLHSPIAWTLGLVVLTRLIEVAVAGRNARRLRAAGWREAGARDYPLFVLLHVSWIATIGLTTPLWAQPVWPLLALVAALQAARAWVIASLGPLWTTQIITRDGAPLVRRGPYRWLRHPAYWIVSIEIAALPLAFRHWGIALVWSLANAALLVRRVGLEDAALAPRRQGLAA